MNAIVTKILTPREKQTCLAAWFDRKKRREIAASQGITSDSVKKRLQRARRRLRAAGLTPPAGPIALRRARTASTNLTENV